MISSLPGKALRMLFDTAWLADIYRILRECLLLSSLPGKTLRTPVALRCLPSDSTSVPKAEPGKLDIKR